MSDLAEIRDQLADMQRSLGRVEGKLDTAVTLESRVRELEDHRQRTDGARGQTSFWSRVATPVIAAVTGALTGAFAAGRLH